MPGKKSRTTQKKVVKTKKLSTARAPKKAPSAPGRKVTSPKGKKTSVKTANTKKVPVKTTKAGNQTAVKDAKKITAAKPNNEPKKKLTGREKMIQEIKKKLVMQRNELLNEAEEALNMLPGQTIFPDMGDQASAEIDRNFMLRLRGREQRLLKKIEQAIEKIDSGSFGICEVCGEEIDVKRLDARPVTTMCIFCKTEQEEEEKLRGK